MVFSFCNVQNTLISFEGTNITTALALNFDLDHPVDNGIVWRTDRQDVRVTKTLYGADCWTDHRLVVSKHNLRIHSWHESEETGRLNAESRQLETRFAT